MIDGVGTTREAFKSCGRDGRHTPAVLLAFLKKNPSAESFPD
jgi:hypothetical protein